jgi:hypothetical protein
MLRVGERVEGRLLLLHKNEGILVGGLMQQGLVRLVGMAYVLLFVGLGGLVQGGLLERESLFVGGGLHHLVFMYLSLGVIV